MKSVWVWCNPKNEAPPPLGHNPLLPSSYPGQQKTRHFEAKEEACAPCPIKTGVQPPNKKADGGHMGPSSVPRIRKVKSGEPTPPSSRVFPTIRAALVLLMDRLIDRSIDPGMMRRAVGPSIQPPVCCKKLQRGNGRQRQTRADPNQKKPRAEVTNERASTQRWSLCFFFHFI